MTSVGQRRALREELQKLHLVDLGVVRLDDLATGGQDRSTGSLLVKGLLLGRC